MAFCDQCGTQLKESSKFCNKCGTPVATGQAEAAQASVPDSGEQAAQKAFNAGMDCVKAGQYDEAIALFTEALHHDPENINVYYKRGLVYDVKEDYDKAVADFSQAIRINPEEAELYSVRGNAYACKDDDDKAVADFTKALQLDPGRAETYGLRAISYIVKGDFAKARADVERGLQIDPANETVADAAEQLKEAGAQGGMSGPSSCSQCGTPLDEGEERTMAFCDQCGNQLKETAKFCNKCGAKVEAGGGGQYVPTATVCSQCGAPLEEGEGFCANCGAKVGAAGQAAIPCSIFPLEQKLGSGSGNGGYGTSLINPDAAKNGGCLAVMICIPITLIVVGGLIASFL
jgi:tetratricopeptide (TPR) repeat protein